MGTVILKTCGIAQASKSHPCTHTHTRCSEAAVVNNIPRNTPQKTSWFAAEMVPFSCCCYYYFLSKPADEPKARTAQCVWCPAMCAGTTDSQLIRASAAVPVPQPLGGAGRVCRSTVGTCRHSRVFPAGVSTTIPVTQLAEEVGGLFPPACKQKPPKKRPAQGRQMETYVLESRGGRTDFSLIRPTSAWMRSSSTEVVRAGICCCQRGNIPPSHIDPYQLLPLTV